MPEEEGYTLSMKGEEERREYVMKMYIYMSYLLNIYKGRKEGKGRKENIQ